ncbi:MAG: methylated-DNA--[protein]-cysteine S-methyltransferase [Chitinophagaceae bacterium]|jgi:AraC family transcriptional regulator, regulatory protein of adaptative response / methylated-DNA-[protein]-cysteine methyltransferase
MQLKKGVVPFEIFNLRVSRNTDPSSWYYDLLQTPFGNLIVAGERSSITYIAFYENVHDALALLQKREGDIPLTFNKGSFSVIDQLLQGGKISSKILLNIKGTDFQKRVWEQLMKIPFGTTISYGEIAAAIGQPGASRAVGSAVGKNPIAYFIPCHRILASGGSIGGYYWGLDVKKKILDWENSLLSH